MVEEDEGIYDAEYILAKRYEGGVPLYLVKWAGYPFDDCTWETYENVTLNGVMTIVQEFEARQFEIADDITTIKSEHGNDSPTLSSPERSSTDDIGSRSTDSASPNFPQHQVSSSSRKEQQENNRKKQTEKHKETKKESSKKDEVKESKKKDTKKVHTQVKKRKKLLLDDEDSSSEEENQDSKKMKLSKESSSGQSTSQQPSAVNIPKVDTNPLSKVKKKPPTEVGSVKQPPFKIPKKNSVTTAAKPQNEQPAQHKPLSSISIPKINRSNTVEAVKIPPNSNTTQTIPSTSSMSLPPSNSPTINTSFGNTFNTNRVSNSTSDSQALVTNPIAQSTSPQFKTLGNSTFAPPLDPRLNSTQTNIFPSDPRLRDPRYLAQINQGTNQPIQNVPLFNAPISPTEVGRAVGSASNIVDTQRPFTNNQFIPPRSPSEMGSNNNFRSNTPFTAPISPNDPRKSSPHTIIRNNDMFNPNPISSSGFSNRVNTSNTSNSSSYTAPRSPSENTSSFKTSSYTAPNQFTNRGNSTQNSSSYTAPRSPSEMTNISTTNNSNSFINNRFGGGSSYTAPRSPSETSSNSNQNRYNSTQISSSSYTAPRSPSYRPPRSPSEMGSSGQPATNFNSSNQFKKPISPLMNENNPKDYSDVKNFDASDEPTRHLWVGRFRVKMDYSAIHKDFEKFGEIDSINFLREQNCAFINFSHLKDAVRAKTELQGTGNYERITYQNRDKKNNPSSANEIKSSSTSRAGGIASFMQQHTKTKEDKEKKFEEDKQRYLSKQTPEQIKEERSPNITTTVAPATKNIPETAKPVSTTTTQRSGGIAAFMQQHTKAQQDKEQKFLEQRNKFLSSQGIDPSEVPLEEPKKKKKKQQNVESTESTYVPPLSPSSNPTTAQPKPSDTSNSFSAKPPGSSYTAPRSPSEMSSHSNQSRYNSAQSSSSSGYRPPRSPSEMGSSGQPATSYFIPPRSPTQTQPNKTSTSAYTAPRSPSEMANISTTNNSNSFSNNRFGGGSSYTAPRSPSEMSSNSNQNRYNSAQSSSASSYRPPRSPSETSSNPNQNKYHSAQSSSSSYTAPRSPSEMSSNSNQNRYTTTSKPGSSYIAPRSPSETNSSNNYSNRYDNNRQGSSSSYRPPRSPSESNYSSSRSSSYRPSPRDSYYPQSSHRPSPRDYRDSKSPYHGSYERDDRFNDDRGSSSRYNSTNSRSDSYHRGSSSNSRYDDYSSSSSRGSTPLYSGSRYEDDRYSNSSTSRYDDGRHTLRHNPSPASYSSIETHKNERRLGGKLHNSGQKSEQIPQGSPLSADSADSTTDHLPYAEIVHITDGKSYDFENITIEGLTEKSFKGVFDSKLVIKGMTDWDFEMKGTVFNIYNKTDPYGSNQLNSRIHKAAGTLSEKKKVFYIKIDNRKYQGKFYIYPGCTAVRNELKCLPLNHTYFIGVLSFREKKE